MDNIRLLIVDDVEDNRLVLRAICRKMEGFEIEEAQDGVEAIQKTDEWHPNIILMDIMMPIMDGFEASKIIKEKYPEVIIIAVTAVIDPHVELNMATIGVGTYIRKPIDKELIRFKLQSFASILRTKAGAFKPLLQREALNPFSKDIRNFKTIFDITDPDAMMDFGVWILSRCEDRFLNVCSRLDSIIELFYELMRQGVKQSNAVTIIIEENFEEMFVTLKLDGTIILSGLMSTIIDGLGNSCIIKENTIYVSLGVRTQTTSSSKESVLVKEKISTEIAVEKIIPVKAEIKKEVRTLNEKDKEVLRQSYVKKTTAREYISEIGGDVLDEIRDLASLDDEWKEKLTTLEEEPSPKNIQIFADGVLGVYVHAINNLFEFTALAYALSSLGNFLKENADAAIVDPKKLKNLVTFMEHLGGDLSEWRTHIFELQDAGDIHYLDSSFFSSCMHIETIITGTEVDSGDDNEMEFF